MGSRGEGTVVAAFLGIVLIGGFNAIAIKFSNNELAPFWGAALRFGLASLLLGIVVVARRLERPRGWALVGSLLYGILNFGLFYALVYWGLLVVPAGLTMIILALVPLLTLVLAVVHGLERFRAQGVLGSLIALAGIAIVFSDQISASPAVLLPLLAIVGAAFASAEANVVVKRLPRSHPVVNNALAMAVGCALLLATSLVAGEAATLPTQVGSIAATAYLVVVGSIGLFMLFLYVIERWTASATSYVLLLMPLITVAAAALTLGEEIGIAALGGGVLVIVGVYIGAFAPSLRSFARPWSRRPAQPAPVEIEVNPCP